MASARILTTAWHNECCSTFIGTACRRTCFWQHSTTVSVPLPSSTFNDRHVKIWAELLEAEHYYRQSRSVKATYNAVAMPGSCGMSRSWTRSMSDPLRCCTGVTSGRSNNRYSTPLQTSDQIDGQHELGASCYFAAEIASRGVAGVAQEARNSGSDSEPVLCSRRR